MSIFHRSLEGVERQKKREERGSCISRELKDGRFRRARGEELLTMHLTCFLSFIRESPADLLTRVLEKRSR